MICITIVFTHYTHVGQVNDNQPGWLLCSDLCGQTG